MIEISVGCEDEIIVKILVGISKENTPLEKPMPT
jgi:hypothetical protein